MKWWRWLVLGCLLLGLAGCEYEEVEREIGYKGAARRNPWLAAERMVASYGYHVESLPGWRAPEEYDAVWFVPASVLSNESFVRQVEKWAREGGHLVVLLEKAGVETSDWRNFGPELEVEPVLARMLERAGMALDQSEFSPSEGRTERDVSLDGEPFRVEAGGGRKVAMDGETPDVFGSVPLGAGRLSAVTDARMFRNRWIAEQEHADLLMALVEVADFEGTVVFIRGASLTFWGLLQRHLWAVLIGLAGLLVLWLWKNLCRFGPLEAASAPPVARSYDHHLEALGNFHWQLDRAAALLGPLRQQVAERSQRGCGRSGRAADELHQWLAERSGLPVARVAGALDAAAPADGIALTRLVADLQILLKLPH